MKTKYLIALLCFIALQSTVLLAGPTTTILDLNDKKDSSIQVNFISHIGNTWTYELSEIDGKDLSHWVLGITCLQDNLVDFTAGAEIGVDGSTGFNGIKWNVGDGFTSGQFSITLDDNYQAGMIDVLVKVGNNYQIGSIYGPTCNIAVPAPSAILLGGLGVAAVGFMKRRKAI